MKLTLAILALLMLGACEQTKTQGYYTSHPDEMKADLDECRRVGKNTYNCNEAAKAEFMLNHR